MASVKFYKNDIAYPKVLADKLNKLADTPDAMEFKGSLGVGGTITALPVDGSAKKGDTYKVITDGTYAGQTAKVGDLFICNEKTSSSNTWVLIPSGDEPSGTVTSVKIEANAPISVNDSTPITSSGTRTISHNTSGVGAGSYGPTADVVGTDNTTIKVPQITVDSYGHITGVAERTYTSKDTDTKVTSAANHYGYASGSGKASGLYKVATDDAGHVTETTAVDKADITALGIPGSDTNTHRPIQVDGTEVLGDNVTPLNLSGGTNISLSDDGSGKVTIDANIPKTEHELIYFSEDNVGKNEYDGLFTQQLMYDDGIVVDNETDFNYCKEHYEYSNNKVGMQAIIGGWTRGYVDNMTSIPKEDWQYKKDTDSIDANKNDNYGNYWADMSNSYYYLKNIADIGFYSGNINNDGIGIIFQRQFKIGNDNYVDKIYLDCGNRYKNHAHCTMSLNISRVKRSESTGSGTIGSGTIVKSLSISTAPENMTSATTAGGYVSIISGTDIVPIAATSSDKAYLTRVKTTKNNKVITFHFSNAFDISTRNTVEHPINYDRYIKIDLQNRKLTIKKQGENATTYNISTTPRVYDSNGNLTNNYLTAPNTQWVNGVDFTDVLNSLAEEAHFGYWQYSTKTGRVYNNYYVTGQKVTFSNIILRTDNKTVWEKNDDGVWVQIPNIKPIDVFTGSRLNYNHITNKLFYSNGGKIYELKTDTNTHRPIQVDGTEVLGDNATPLNLSGGTNISLSDDGSGKVTIDANIPKAKHELIYFSEDKVGENEYDGLFTQQLMYDDGIVVDNPTDLSKCKGKNDFAFLEIKDTWGTELISHIKTDVGNTDYLKPGGIVNTSNGFWYYNASTNTLDAKFNDNNYGRYAFLYNPDTSTHVFHDALYGFYKDDDLNDTIGCGFIGFGTTSETDGSNNTWYPTVVLRFNLDPIQKPPTFSSDNSIFRACNMNFTVYKRCQNYTPHTYIADNYLTQTPAYSFGIIGTSSANKVTGSTVENGKCVVLNTELIDIPEKFGKPGKSGGTYCGPSYVRVITEKDGDVITWKFSQILSEKITNLEAQKPDIIIGTKVQIDLANYKVRYITSGETSWNEYDVGDPYKKYFDILKNDTHFGFGQASTPSGRIYNITTSEHRLLLDIDTDNVWKNVNGTWSIYQGKTPLELMTGSRLNYNNITDKLWYSNGSQIYELKTDYDSSVTINPSTHTITGIDEIKKTNYRIKSGNANNQFNTYGGMVLPHQSWNGEVLMLETKDGNVEGNVARESAGIIISESEGVQVFAPCNGNSRTIFSVYDEDDLVTGNPTPIFSVNDDPGIRCYGALDVTSSVTLENGLYVTGDTYCTGAYYSSSDMRKKDILEEISLDKAYELVNKCQTIFYTWKDDETKKKEIGLIAQEVQQYFPELVSEDKDGYLTLDYSKLTVILLVVIHDLTQKVSKIDTLEEKIKQLENKIQ